MPFTGNKITHKYITEAAQANFSGLSDNLKASDAEALVRAGFVAGGGSGFTIDNLSDIEVLLQADDASTISVGAPDQVMQWDDKSGNGHDAVQLSAPDQPLTNQETLNGLNVLTFNTQFMEIPFTPGINPLEVTSIAVVKTDNPGSAGGYATTTNGFFGGGFVTVSNASNHIAFVSNDIGLDVVVDTKRTPVSGEWFIIALTHKQLPLSELSIDGVIGGRTSVLPIAYAAPRDMSIGRIFNGVVTNTLDGGVAEYRMWTRAMNISELLAQVNDLKLKWGIP